MHWRIRTPNELADTDLGVEVAAADAAVELLALAARGVLVVEVAGVLHGDVVTVLGLVLAVAGGDQSLGDTHVDCCACEGSGVDWGEGCWERGRKSGAREEAEGHFSRRASIRPTVPGTHREEGQRAWGPLDFASWVEHFLGSRGRASTARTPIPRPPMLPEEGWVRAPRGRLDVAIVPARVGAYAYDMRWTSFLLWFAVQNDRRTRPHNGLREATGMVGESLESSSHGTSSERRTSRLHLTHPLGRIVPKKQEQQGVLHVLKPVTAV